MNNNTKIITLASLSEYRGMKTLSKTPTPQELKLMPLIPTGSCLSNGIISIE